MSSISARLPGCFEPVAGYDLERFGKDFDGGYLVDPRSVADAQLLLSFGMNEDWSFERSFCAYNDVPVEMYDASVGRREFKRRVRKKFATFYRIRHLLRAINLVRSYDRFFRGKRRHHMLMIGFDSETSRSASSVFTEHATEKTDSVFFKVDIEGSEYRILDDLLAAQSKIAGMVIEFHDIDLHMDRIRAFVSALDLNICHCHGNNFGGMDAQGQPLVIELSFSRYAPQKDGKAAFPHPLDMANKRDHPDYALKFGG